MRQYGLISILLLWLIGCAGIKYTDTIQPIDLSNSQENEKIAKVLAKAEVWRNSGVIVKKGVKYHIAAEGRWKLGGVCPWTDADGIGGNDGLCVRFNTVAVEGWTGAALVGKISENGFPFAVGKKHELIAKEDGILYFRINENSTYYDNEGFQTVKIAANNYNITPQNLFSETSPNERIQVSNRTPNQWAVIIGISQYQYSGKNGLINLIFADDDAKTFARSLRNLGWSESHIKLLTNEDASQRNIMIALKSWLTKAGPDDQIVLFWAGHGYPDPEDPEKVYLATYDTDISIPATGYRMDEVRKALEEIGSKNVILFADTCHAGKLITRGDGSRGISIVPNIRQQNTPKGWVFMVGADTDRQAVEDTSWSNGAFTHSLIIGLNGAADGFQSIGPKDGTVTMGELRAYMNTAMPEETQKVLGVAKRPVITTSTGDPDIWNLTLQVKH